MKFTPGTTFYTSLNHVSKSGMSRWISVYVARNNEIVDVTQTLIDLFPTVFKTRGAHPGIYVSGCGMDMGFHLVYTLGRLAFPDGYLCNGVPSYDPDTYASNDNPCRSNDHVNDPTLPYSDTTWHRDGGYAFEQRWL